MEKEFLSAKRFERPGIMENRDDSS